MLGISRAVIFHYEHYGRIPSLTTGAKLADLYGIDLTWLATGVGDPIAVQCRVRKARTATSAKGTGMPATSSEER
jgi:hypothetical protein